MQSIFQTENADKALKYRLYRHLPAYEKIIRNLVSFLLRKKIGFFEYTFYYYRKDNDTAMTKNPSMQHFTSNISVTKRWFEYVDNSDLTEQDKKVIMRRFANGYMYNLKMISCLEKKEYEIVTGMMMREKKMMKYIGGFPCKYIYILTKIIGCRNTSNLLNLIKGER